MHSVQFSSVTQSCLTLCDPMNCSTPGLPVHHQLLESPQTYVHWVSDAIQPSHPLSSPSPPALNLSQHQGLFKWVSSSHQVVKVLEFQLQHQSFQWTPKTAFLCYDITGENNMLERGTRVLRAGACQDCPKNTTKMNEAIYTGMSRGGRRKKWDQNARWHRI